MYYWCRRKASPTTPVGKATALILDKDDVVQLREIEASKAIGDQWVVTSGLQAGDRVIVSGLQRIRPGIKARAISSSRGKRQHRIETITLQA